MHLEYVRIHVIYRVDQAEYGIHIRVVAPQEYVNIYSTHRAVCAESAAEAKPKDLHAVDQSMSRV